MTLQSSCSSLILCSVCEVEKAPQQTLNLPVLHLGVPCFQTCELQPAVCKPVCVWQCSHINLNGLRQLATEWWRADHRASLNRCCWYQVHRQEHSPLLLPLALAGQIPCHRGGEGRKGKEREGGGGGEENGSSAWRQKTGYQEGNACRPRSSQQSQHTNNNGRQLQNHAASFPWLNLPSWTLREREIFKM